MLPKNIFELSLDTILERETPPTSASAEKSILLLPVTPISAS